MSRYLLTPLLLMIMAAACTPTARQPLRIALSWSTPNYENWLKSIDSTIQTVDMKSLPVDSALEVLQGCDGLLLTGGEDVMPSWYGKAADSGRCKVNPERDTLEFALFRTAKKKKIPILGICRGQQLINVVQGGTLTVDIPADRPSGVSHQCEDYTTCFHHVTIEKGSLLQTYCKADTGTVNTNHHQAIEKLAPTLKISAASPDGIPEAVEWADPEAKTFLMAVQWHPERMPLDNPLSGALGRAFLQAAIFYQATH